MTSSSRRPRRRRPAGALLALAALAAGGCSRGDDTAPVARVGDWTLTTGRLADLLVLAQPFPLDSASVQDVVDQWISVSAFAQRVNEGADLTGPEAVDASVWVERQEALVDADYTAQLGEAPTVSRSEAAATFDSDSLLLLAHVLRRTNAASSDAERALQRRTAEEILQGLLSGGKWTAAVARSEDDRTRSSSGLLGLFALPEVPPYLRTTASHLKAGQVSSVLQGPDGFHLLYRPLFADVADLYAQLLSQRRARERVAAADGALLDSLAPRAASDAAATARGLARDPTPSLESGHEDPSLLTWEGGSLTREVAARYVAALAPDARSRLEHADDGAVLSFLRDLAVRQARIDDAHRRGIQPDSARMAQLGALHDQEVDAWREALGGSSGANVSREAVDRYMERVVARQTTLRPFPPLFRAWLLEPLDWSEDPGGIERGIGAARRLLAAVDSSADRR